MMKKIYDSLPQVVKSLLRQTIKELFPNCIINKIPCIMLRMWYYKYILNIKIQNNVFIQLGCYIYNSREYFNIGTNTIINRNCILDRRGGLHIGENVNISPEVAIFTSGHDPQSPSFEERLNPVAIYDHVWLGTRSMIMPGVTIHEGAVILPGSVVTQDVEAYKIVGGVPAKVVAERKQGMKYELGKFSNGDSWRPLFM
ncbi:MAG: hypothetical protein H6Q68_3069 [Firmicutes bacterium]|nr:hypothetical protein [Bacillota bacterium]